MERENSDRPDSIDVICGALESSFMSIINRRELTRFFDQDDLAVLSTGLNWVETSRGAYHKTNEKAKLISKEEFLRYVGYEMTDSSKPVKIFSYERCDLS